MHDSFTPLGGLVPLFNIQLGEVVFGGVGAGLYGMLIFVILAVFLTGLMVGRTPEYLGKKIEAYDVKVSVLALLILIFSILGFSAWALGQPVGPGRLAQRRPAWPERDPLRLLLGRGQQRQRLRRTERQHAPYNITLALAMLFGRFVMMVPVLALAGSLAGKKIAAGRAKRASRSSGPIFVIILIGTVLIVGALTFLPALALGPIVEHFLMTGSGILY